MILDDHGGPIPLDLRDLARLDRALDRVEVPNFMLSLRRRQPILHVLHAIASLPARADVGEGCLYFRPVAPSTAPDTDPALHGFPAGEGHDTGGAHSASRRPRGTHMCDRGREASTTGTLTLL